eukprot:TRINITY_DN2036_c0_g1_i1.p1 TRINITY_DN2036_c0_g1~~TRINITY_DN2036_c0_g1_i1.p1  ORF type:complete len:466 (+),score=155.54 TRINITY_DN2036_c0_g1_i1:642-2039(+)
MNYLRNPDAIHLEVRLNRLNRAFKHNLEVIKSRDEEISAKIDQIKEQRIKELKIQKIIENLQKQKKAVADEHIMDLNELNNRGIELKNLLNSKKKEKETNDETIQKMTKVNEQLTAENECLKDQIIIMETKIKELKENKNKKVYFIKNQKIKNDKFLKIKSTINNENMKYFSELDKKKQVLKILKEKKSKYENLLLSLGDALKWLQMNEIERLKIEQKKIDEIFVLYEKKANNIKMIKEKGDKISKKLNYLTNDHELAKNQISDEIKEYSDGIIKLKGKISELKGNIISQKKELEKFANLLQTFDDNNIEKAKSDLEEEINSYIIEVERLVSDLDTIKKQKKKSKQIPLSSIEEENLSAESNEISLKSPIISNLSDNLDGREHGFSVKTNFDSPLFNLNSSDPFSAIEDASHLFDSLDLDLDDDYLSPRNQNLKWEKKSKETKVMPKKQPLQLSIQEIGSKTIFK